MSIDRLVRIMALAARLSEADAHRWPLAVYVRQARAMVVADEGPVS